MNVVQTPQGHQWAALVDALHALTNTMTVRTHYGASHPAIARADAHCFESFTRVLAELSPILIAFTEGEFVLCERPFPDLRDRLHMLSQAMGTHEIECILVHRGMTRAECEVLGTTLNLSADVPGRVREQAQAKLTHVLLRFLETKIDGVVRRRAGVDVSSLVPEVRAILEMVTSAMANEAAVDVPAVMTLAKEIRSRCATRSFTLETRSVVDGRDDLAAHATNAALVAGALGLEMQYPEAIALDVIAAALVHDVGHAFSPERIRNVPSPLLGKADVAAFSDHTIEGARGLLLAGCPELWVMTALEHHRGVDGRGFPSLGTHAPHELVRVVALASFIDHKRTLLPAQAIDPAAILKHALSLEDRYFGRPLVRRLIRAIGAYPPGTTVELSNREPALVTQANGGDPWRPQVQLLRGEDVGARIELRELSSVGARYELSAVRAIAPPLFVEADIRVEAPDVMSSAVVPRAASPGPRVVDVDAVLREILAEEEEPLTKASETKASETKVPPLVDSPEPEVAAAIDDVRGKLLEFLSDPPPASPAPSSRPSERSNAPSAYSNAPPRIIESTAKQSPSATAYSSRPPEQIESTTSAPPAAAVVTSSKPPPSSVSKPPASFGAYSSAPPRIVETTTKRPSIVTKRPPSVGGYSSRPPEPPPTSMKPPPSSMKAPASAGVYSSRPPELADVTAKAPASSSQRPASSAGAYSSQPPRSSEREEQMGTGARGSNAGPSRSTSLPPSSSRPVARPSRPPRSMPVCIASAADLARQRGLDTRVGFLFSMIDGKTTIEEIADASGMAEKDVSRLIDDLVARGLVTMKEG